MDQNSKTSAQENISPDLLKKIDVVLCRSRYGGNIGSVARAIKNMGLGRLVLVRPEDYMESEARMMAASAGDVLAAASRMDSLEEALSGYDLTLAASRRLKSSRQRIMSPREASGAVIHAARGSGAALVFGTEDSGLNAEEVAACNGVVSIPSDENYPSLNLSQAVMVVAYELRMTLEDSDLAVRSFGGPSRRERSEMLDQVGSVLERSGFFIRNPRERVMLHIAEILENGIRTSQDARIIRGAFRRIIWTLENTNGENEQESEDEN
jgi:TrmH family RNA methyltransferase